jgi:hypothetical protein
MTTGIRILYNGKEFKSLEKASIPDLEKLLTQGMEENIHAALASLLPQIEEEGGEVTVNFKAPMMFEISTTGLSEELHKKVVSSLTPPD